MGLWLVLYLASVVLYNVSYSRTSSLLVHALQVKPAAILLDLTLAGDKVRSEGSIIFTETVRMDIARGCDGIETWLLMVTAFLTYPMSVNKRVGAVAWGSLIVFVLNYIRIVSMFYVVIRRPGWFDFVHDTLWQGGMVMVCLLFVHHWLKPRTQDPPI